MARKLSIKIIQYQWPPLEKKAIGPHKSTCYRTRSKGHSDTELKACDLKLIQKKKTRMTQSRQTRSTKMTT